MNSDFTDLGVGVGLRSPHYELFKNEIPKSVSWVEVISENFMSWENGDQGTAHRLLIRLRKDIPVVLHGVSLNIGSADPVNKNYLRRLKELINAVQPSLVSDHLCWTGVDGENLHDLMPLPYTRSVLKHVAEKIDAVQNFLGRKILIENPSSYLEFQNSEMTEADFLAELTEAADCGILLDINNVYVSSVNHGFSPNQYLEKIPRKRIGQIHLAGHIRSGDYLIDTHDQPVPPEVWQLYRWFTANQGKCSTMIERDGNIPEWNFLEQELLQIKEIRDEKSQQHLSV